MDEATQSGRISSVEIVHRKPVALPGLWHTFVLVMLVFGGVSAIRLTLDVPGVLLLLIGLAKIAGLIGLFLWLTLRDSLGTEDVSPAGVQRPTLYRRLLVISGMLLLTIALIPVLPDFQLWWLLIYPMVAAGLSLPLIPAKLMIAGLTVLSITCAWFYGDGFQPILLTQAVLALGAVIIRILTVTNIELESSRETAARLAVTEERLRFARDLHDSLGHSLSTIALKSELSGRVLEQDPGRAGSEIQDVERVARDSLRELRAVVTGYRQPSLAQELEAARGVLETASINYEISGDVDQLPAELDAVLAWGVREGVTNVIRHSGANNCTIRVVRDNGTIRLELTDDGGLNAQRSAQRPGSGLTGLSERAATAGGRLAASARPDGGFELILEAPLNSGEPA